mmetsp:Transcript_6613/g.11258  ORF Transcript_6613/g.11258 Transcript_6613/m.11258 type:complete len:142 (-) Transcript_6613:276-701(-)
MTVKTSEPSSSSHGTSESEPEKAAPPDEAGQQDHQTDTQNQTSAQAEEEPEDPNECGWCKWMKAGGCKSEFEVWLKCVDDVRDAGRADVESCSAIMAPLWDCMQKNADYYEPQMDALKGGEEGEKEQKAEKEAKSDGLAQV